MMERCRSLMVGFACEFAVTFFYHLRPVRLTQPEKRFVSKNMPKFTDDLKLEQPLIGKRILFAEDQEHLRTIIVMMLEELGADVVSVGDGTSVLYEYSRNTEGIDLVLMDIKMSGLAGTETYERLMEMDPEVKVVLTSGTPPDAHLITVLEGRRGGFIEKPFNLAHLGDVLCRVLQGEHVVLSP
jgi:CheY-like chemotaxis protein